VKERREKLSNRIRYALLNEVARRVSCPQNRTDGVVVFSPGHLGDILHAVPMLKALRTGRPMARIIWLVGPWSEALAYRYADLVDEIRVFGPNLPPYTRGHRVWRQSAWRQWRMAMALRREGVRDLIAAADPVGRFLANAVCPTVWVGVGDWRPSRVRNTVETRFQPYEKDRYEADAWTGVLQGLGIDATADRLDYKVTSDERQAAVHFLNANGVDSSRPLALLAPGSGWAGKNWLPERFSEVAAYLVKEKGLQVAWVGSPEENRLVPQLDEGQFNWTGMTRLPLLAAVMEQARLFVGNDGGLLHFATALNVPTVSIWGPTSPGKWGTKGPLHRQIRKVDRCDGCIYWDVRESCRHDQRCMKAVPVDEVLSAIESVLEI